MSLVRINHSTSLTHTLPLPSYSLILMPHHSKEILCETVCMYQLMSHMAHAHGTWELIATPLSRTFFSTSYCRKWEFIKTCKLTVISSLQVRMSHVACEWVMSYMNESSSMSICEFGICQNEWDMSPRRPWHSLFRWEWVIFHVNESRLIWSIHFTYEWVVPHGENMSCHTWMIHITYEWVVSHMNEFVTYEYVMSQINESCHTYE